MVSTKEFVFNPPKFSRSTFYLLVFFDDEAVTSAAERVGLHNPALERMEEHSIPHFSCHGFITHLIHAEMRHEFIQELRGDSRYRLLHKDRRETRERASTHAA